MNENLRTASLPRANPADIQAVVNLWKEKHPQKCKDELRAWLFLVVNHWFPPSQEAIDKAAEVGTIQDLPRGPFVAACWCTEDVEKCRAALEAMP